MLEWERSAEPPKNVGKTLAILLIASWDELRVAWASPTFLKLKLSLERCLISSLDSTSSNSAANSGNFSLYSLYNFSHSLFAVSPRSATLTLKSAYTSSGISNGS